MDKIRKKEVMDKKTSEAILSDLCLNVRSNVLLSLNELKSGILSETVSA